jgi:hypothetical protein
MNFSDKDLVKIYNFYLYKSFAASSPQKISVKEYGWESTKSKLNGYGAMLNDLKEKTHIEFYLKKCKKKQKDSIDLLLSKNHLSDDKFNNEKPVAVLEQQSRETDMTCLLRHIRNAIAHGNTYQFGNGNILLEDMQKREKGIRITARILINKDTLTDLIKVIDKNNILKKIK